MSGPNAFPSSGGETEMSAPATEEANSSAQNEDEQQILRDLAHTNTDGIRQRARLIDNEIRVFKSELQRLNHELHSQKASMKENEEKITLNRQLPHLVGTVAEILDADDEDDDSDEKAAKLQKTAGTAALAIEKETAMLNNKKSIVVNTTTRQTIYLPIPGLVAVSELKPSDLVGLNKDSYLILDKLPSDFDSRVKAMEVDERPTDQYSDIGGCDKQIQEMIEAIVLPMTHKERFDNLGIAAPKGLLLYGPPGTGKTLMARACAAATNATFLKLAGPQLVQMFIGDGAKMVRDAFDLAKEKAPAIIFIDELDAIGVKRSRGGELSGVREVQRTMLELLNQLDGFSKDDRVKVIAATNRADILDPALLRSGRLDRKIELPHPNEDARARILQIHSRKMNVNKDDVNFTELARCTVDFNGAQVKTVCVEAGMEALRRGATELQHEDFMQGIQVVQAKKKTTLNYYA